MPVSDKQEPYAQGAAQTGVPLMGGETAYVDMEAQRPAAQTAGPVLKAKTTANPFSYADFWAKKVQHGFIMRVFGILSIQLLITFGMCLAFSLSDNGIRFVIENYWLMPTTYVMSFVLLIVLICTPSLLLRSPTNVTLCLIWTVLFSYAIAATCAFYTAGSVAIAIGATLGLTAILTAFACQTRIDFTPILGCLIAILWASIFMSFFYFAFYPYSWYAYYGYPVGFDVFWCWMGIVLFSLFIVVDVQIVVHKFSNPGIIAAGLDFAVIAAMNIYLDVINLFLYILMLVGKAK